MPIHTPAFPPKRQPHLLGASSGSNERQQRNGARAEIHRHNPVGPLVGLDASHNGLPELGRAARVVDLGGIDVQHAVSAQDLRARNKNERNR